MVAEQAQAEVDVRVETLEDAVRLDRLFTALQSADPPMLAEVQPHGVEPYDDSLTRELFEAHEEFVDELLSAFTGAVVGIALIVLRGRDRNIPIPFGPYLAAAGWIALMWGPQIVGGYLSMAGLDR